MITRDKLAAIQVIFPEALSHDELRPLLYHIAQSVPNREVMAEGNLRQIDIRGLASKLNLADSINLSTFSIVRESNSWRLSYDFDLLTEYDLKKGSLYTGMRYQATEHTFTDPDMRSLKLVSEIREATDKYFIERKS